MLHSITPRRALLLLPAAAICFGAAALHQDGDWKVHDMDRPQPSTVTAGAPSCDGTVGSAPSDAIVLFDGSGTAHWQSGKGDAKWIVDAAKKMMTVAPRTGDISTKEDFGDVQFHIEWQIPADRQTKGQGGGNSGIFFMNRYEIQILNANGNTTYPDGTAASFYGQHPPLVNPCRPKGQWNVYDIVFHAPKWDDAGVLLSPANATVIFNGVLVQDHQVFWGETSHARRAKYSAPHGEGPIRLQDHGDPIQFRNIWVRRLGG